MKLNRRFFAIILVLITLLSNSGLTSLAEVVLKMPAALRVIDIEAFYGDKSINKVVLPNKVTEIHARAFANSSLSEINLPSSLTFIDDTAFDGLDNVTITATEGSFAYQWAVDHGYITPSEDFEYSITNNECTITSYTGSEASVVIPSTINGVVVRHIGEKAFLENTQINSLIVPGTVRTIGEWAFRKCKNLSKVVLNDGLETIGDRAFSWCTSLTAVVIPDSVTMIDGAFTECNNLNSVVLSKKIKTIGEMTFYHCYALKDIIIPDNVMQLGQHAFRECGFQTIVLPDNLTIIDNSAFEDCPNLQSIFIPNTVVSIGDYAFKNCPKLESVFLNNGLQKIGIQAFIDSVSLKRIYVPGSVKEIGNWAFWGCKNLSRATLENGVEKLGEKVFNNCINLTSAFIPISVTSIGDNCFYNHSNYLVIYGETGSCAQKYADDNNITFTPSAQADGLKIEKIEFSGNSELHVNDVVTWTTEISNAVGQVKYNYTLNCDGKQIDKILGSNYNSYQAVLNKEGSYTLIVEVKDDSGSTCSLSSNTLTVNKKALTIDSITFVNGEAVVGDDLIWEAAVSGGTAPYSYRFDVYQIIESGDTKWRSYKTLENNRFIFDYWYWESTDAGQWFIQVSVTDASGAKTSRTSQAIQLKDSPILIKEGDYIPCAGRLELEDTINDLGGSAEVTIISNGRWTATPVQPWLSVFPSTGSSGSTLTLTASKNLGSRRTGLVAVTCEDRTAYIELVQYAMLPEKPVILEPKFSEDITAPTTLTSMPSSIRVVWEPDDQKTKRNIQIREVGGSIIQQSGTLEFSTSEYVFSDLNLKYNKLYRITCQRTTNDGHKNRKVEMYFIIQNGPQSVSASCTMPRKYSSNLQIDYDGEEDWNNIDVLSSGSWVAIANNDWLMVSKDKQVDQNYLIENDESREDYLWCYGENGESFNLYAFPNDSKQNRIGTVTLVSGTAKATITVNQEKYYVPAKIISPTLGSRRDSVSIIPGDMKVQWSAASGGTGKYKLRLYEYSENSGYVTSFTANDLTNRSYIIPSDKLKEGTKYEIDLYTEISSGKYTSQSYYFRVSYANELTVDVKISGTGTIGDNDGIRVDAKASGGSGGYKYCFYLMKNKEIINRSIGWDSQSFWTFVLPDVGNYYVQVYAKDSDGTQVSFDSSAVTAVESSEYITIDNKASVSKDIEASTTTLTVPVTASKNWTFSKDVTWLTIDASGYKNSNLKVTASANAGSSIRCGHVTVTCGSKQAVLTINQSGSGNVSVSSTTLDFGSSSSSQQVTVTSSTSWSASPSDSWISVSPSTGGSGANLRINVTGNNNGGMRNGSVTITAGGARTVISINQQGTSIASIERVWNIKPVQTGVATNISVTAKNATYIRMIIDGKYYTPEYICNPDFANVAYVRYTFSSSGTRSLRFSAYSNGVWYDDSTTYTLEVTAPNGDLDVPVVKTDKAVYKPKEKPIINWTDKGNAKTYKIYLTKDSELIRTIEQTGKRLELTASDTEMAGHYAVTIMSAAPGYEQAQSGVEFDVQWEGYLQCKSATAYANKDMTTEQPSLQFGRKYTIAEERIWGSITVGKIMSGNVVLGYTDLSNFGTEYWHPCLKNGVFTHNYYTTHEAAHPHKEFEKCSVCEEWQYTGNNARFSGNTPATCCLCGNHSYHKTSISSEHPHYEIKTCSRCGNAKINTSVTTSAYPGCCACNGHTWGSNGFCTVCGQFSVDKIENKDVQISEANVQTQGDEYIEYVNSLIPGGSRYDEFMSWLNYNGDYTNEGYLLLELTQKTLNDKGISANSNIWKAKKIAWGLSELGIGTAIELFKNITGNSTDIKQYSEILEKSYLIVAATSMQREEDFIKPYANIKKALNQSDSIIRKLIDNYKEKMTIAAEFQDWSEDDILKLYKESIDLNEPWDDLTKLAKFIERYKNIKTIVDGGYLIFDGVKLGVSIKNMRMDKASFMISLVSASNEQIEALRRLRHRAGDIDLGNAIDKFLESYKAAMSESIEDYATKYTFSSNWTDIASFSQQCVVFFTDKFLGIKIPTSACSALGLCFENVKDAFSAASLIMNTARIGTDLIMDTSAIQSSVEQIDKMVTMKDIESGLIMGDINAFRMNPSKENAVNVIMDIKNYRTYQVIGEQYAQKFYNERLDDKLDKDLWYAFFFTSVPISEIGSLNEKIDEEQRRLIAECNSVKQEFEKAVEYNMNVIYSFYIPD